MSVKVMIVDDEHLGRALIRLGIEWEANGFEIMGEADSGKSALDFMEQKAPDILFTDICMPFMDGLELTQQVRERYPRVRIVIMTGHREFEYAQRAVKLGVTEFLLKPINSQEVLKIVLKLKQEIMEQKAHEKEIDSIRAQLSRSLPIMKERFINELIHGGLAEEQVPELLKKYNAEFVLGQSFCLLIKLCWKNPGAAAAKELKSSIIQRVELLIDSVYAGCETNEEDYVLLIEGACEDSRILILRDGITELLADYPEYSINMGVGGRYTGVPGLLQSYKEAKDAVKARVVYGHNRVIYFHQLDALRQENSKLLEGNWHEFSSFIKNGMADKAKDYIHNYILWISRTGSLDIQIIRLLCNHVVTVNLAVLHEQGKRLSQVFPCGYDVSNEISKVDTLEDMERLLQYFVSKVILYIQSNKEKKSGQLVEDTKRYIEEHLCESNLSLKVMAKILYVNESYLSRVFKAEAGENITDYILRLRISKAMEYVNETKLKAYEISERIGFNDSHYFSLCFKKYTGKSINEYRKSTSL